MPEVTLGPEIIVELTRRDIYIWLFGFLATFLIFIFTMIAQFYYENRRIILTKYESAISFLDSRLILLGEMMARAHTLNNESNPLAFEYRFDKLEEVSNKYSESWHESSALYSLNVYDHDLSDYVERYKQAEANLSIVILRLLREASPENTLNTEELTQSTTIYREVSNNLKNTLLKVLDYRLNKPLHYWLFKKSVIQMAQNNTQNNEGNES